MNRCDDCNERIPVDCGAFCPSCANEREWLAVERDREWWSA